MNIKLFARFNNIIANLPTRLRMSIYRNLSGGIHNNAFIGPNCIIDNPKSLFLDDGSNINRFCRFMTSSDREAKVYIGKNTWVGCNVSFICISHEIGESNQRAGKTVFSPIVVGNGVWIGADVTILPGVNISDGCIIGAGSVVTKDTFPNGLYVGNPARRIKDLT